MMLQLIQAHKDRLRGGKRLPSEDEASPSSGAPLE
jgi:hypothetical protein